MSPLLSLLIFLQRFLALRISDRWETLLRNEKTEESWDESQYTKNPTGASKPGNGMGYLKLRIPAILAESPCLNVINYILFIKYILTF